MNILAFSGKKQSGKNTCCNHILGLFLVELGLVKGSTKVTEEGLWISDLFGGDTDYEGIFDIQRENETMRRFREEELDPYIRIYSFADLLKKNICIDILGLYYEQCYGRDEDKESLTDLMWENMPGVVTEKTPIDKQDYEKCLSGLIYHEPGPMTAREVLQYVGTEVFRKMYGDVWADATIRKIREDAPQLALICDCRFPNEVDVVQKAGGKVIRLTRSPFNDDVHKSEKALDKDRFDWAKFDAIIPNHKLSIAEQSTELNLWLEGWFA